MAMVLDAFASYVQNMLTEMATEEVRTLLGVRDEIDKMGDKLGDLKRFLADADRRNITDTSVQEWVGQLKRAMYEATDILDLCQLKTMEQGSSTVDVGCCNPLLFCLQNPLHAHDIGRRIKALNQRLDEIKERSAAFSFINLGSYEDRVHVSHPGNPSRETSGELDRSGVVGEKIEEDTRKLVEMMLTEKEGNNNIMVVAIVGVGGIGKTTLAKKVFNDEAMNAKFDKTIWLSINQDFDKVKLLRTAITQAGGDHRSGEALAVLQPTLTTALTGKKLLLVLDDVWSHGAWGEVLEIPLVNAVARGSRVLVTTRDERVARGMKAVLPYHHVDELEEEDAWQLLKKQVVSSETDGPEIDMLKDIGLQIVTKCGGLPLAIKVMGGLLCQKDKQRRDWEMVLNDSVWSVSEMPEELNYAVYLSYGDLPPFIKQCFLYYCLLPKSVTFHIDDVIGMWISEGFLHGIEDLDELGRNYHRELIMRNLIEPNRLFVDHNLCIIHDVVRSFGQFVARDEALAAYSGENDIISKLSAHKFLRLSLDCKVSESNGLAWSSLRAQKTLRTLISTGLINMKPSDSLVDFPCLRTLIIRSANITVLVETLGELKHLRYLGIWNSDISRLPDNIGRMKLLQYISLLNCESLVELPDSIVKLEQLRHLCLTRGTCINGIPRGFCVLTNLRRLNDFPAKVDGDWCSLEELAPLSQLRFLGLRVLENVSNTSSATKARLCEKVHLTNLILDCSTRLGDGLIEEEEGVSEEEQRRIEEVFDELCPPPSLDQLCIRGYFGQRLTRWMMSSLGVPLKGLRILHMSDLPCCTQLPDGLCQLPCLEFLNIERAPSIKRVGPEFLRPYHHHNPRPTQAVAAFSRLHKMNLAGMVEWEEWEWEEQVQAFPVLEVLSLGNCKLRRVPPGLAYNARALRKLFVHCTQHLSYLENFASVVELGVSKSPSLERITNLPNLHKLEVTTCPKLKALEGVDALQMLILEDYAMETLPEYMRDVNPRHLELCCSLALLTSIAAGQSGPEWDKFSHVEHVKAYAHDENSPRKWYVLYTKEPCSLDTNTSRSFLSGGTLLSSMVDAQGFESAFKMRRRTFSYICSLVNEDTMVRDSSYTFVDGTVLSLEDRVAVALRALNSGEPLETVGSSVGVDESTVLLVTGRFVDAMYPLERAPLHYCWPGKFGMEKIKYKFDKIHGLPNCCGVVHTTCIPFGPNSDHEKNGGLLLQALVDPDMRFTHVCLGLADSSNQLSVLDDSGLFKLCEKGEWLNGSKLKLSDGSEVGEYIIGDAGYPLLPWLLTPYQDNNLSDSKAEFNRRHSAARTLVIQALARFEDTWKCLHGGMWYSDDTDKLRNIVLVCQKLHNIVIDMEEAGMPRYRDVYSKQVRRLADENAIRVRDILSQHLIESGVDPVDEEEEQEVVSSGSGDKDEQEAH